MRIIDDNGSNIDKAWVQFPYCGYTISVSNHPPEITIFKDSEIQKDKNRVPYRFEASIDGIIEARDMVDHLTGNDLGEELFGDWPGRNE